MTDKLPSAEDAQKLLDGTTPGPWRKRDCDVVVGEGLTAKTICHFWRHWSNDEEGIEQTEPNAALAAAAPDLARALIASEAARKDAEAAVALVVERAATEIKLRRHLLENVQNVVIPRAEELAVYDICEEAVRALADTDGMALVQALRAERDAAVAEVARFQEDRAYVIGANDGWDAAVEQGEASPAVGKAMTRFWKRMAETHSARAAKTEADRDRLAAQLADAQAAQALVVERAGLAVANVEIGFHDGISGDWHPMDGPSIISACCAAIRALADPSGVEALAALRAERDDLAERLQSAMMDGHDLAKNEYRDAIQAAEAERDRLAAANAALEDKVARLVGAAQPFADVADLFDSEVEGVGASDTLSLWLNGDNEEPAWRAMDFKLGDFGALYAALAEVQADARREGGE